MAPLPPQTNHKTPARCWGRLPAGWHRVSSSLVILQPQRSGPVYPPCASCLPPPALLSFLLCPFVHVWFLIALGSWLWFLSPSFVCCALIDRGAFPTPYSLLLLLALPQIQPEQRPPAPPFPGRHMPGISCVNRGVQPGGQLRCRGTVPSLGLAGGTRGCCQLLHPGGVVQAAGDRSVVLTQVGTRLAPGAVGKHTCLGRARGCFGIPTARAGPSTWSLKSLLGRRELRSCTSPCAHLVLDQPLPLPKSHMGASRLLPAAALWDGDAVGRGCVNRGLIQASQSKGKSVVGLLIALVLLWVLARREKSPTVPHGD